MFLECLWPWACGVRRLGSTFLGVLGDEGAGAVQRRTVQETASLWYPPSRVTGSGAGRSGVQVGEDGGPPGQGSYPGGARPTDGRRTFVHNLRVKMLYNSKPGRRELRQKVEAIESIIARGSLAEKVQGQHFLSRTKRTPHWQPRFINSQVAGFQFYLLLLKARLDVTSREQRRRDRQLHVVIVLVTPVFNAALALLFCSPGGGTCYPQNLLGGRLNHPTSHLLGLA